MSTRRSDMLLAEALGQLRSLTRDRGTRGHVVGLLREDCDIYRGRSAVEAERLRAFLMSELVKAGEAHGVLSEALEELQSGTDPYGAAAAARVVRSVGQQSSETAALLATSLERIRHADDFVDLDTYPGQPGPDAKTAVEELVEAMCDAGPGGLEELRSLHARAVAGRYLSEKLIDRIGTAVAVERGCCGGTTGPPPPRNLGIIGSRPLAGIEDLELQNQDRVTLRMRDLLNGRPALFAFFYSRCMNPEKCSRTISKLAEVANKLSGSSVVLAAFSYDPDYDDAMRLRRYGDDRSFPFGPACHLLRTSGPFEPLRAAFGLGVGYGENTVNRHRVEYFVLDPRGIVRKAAAGSEWCTSAMTRSLRQLAGADA